MADATTGLDREDFARRGEAIGYYAATAPDLPAVIIGDEAVTYGALDRRANQLVRALAERGVGPGSAVAMMVTNRVEFIEVWAAAMRGGLRLTPINWHLTAEEAGYIVENCEAKAFIGDAQAAGSHDAAGDHLVRLAAGGPIEGFDDYRDVVDATDEGPVDAQLGHLMLYTSGTTGHPKGVAKAPGNAAADLINANSVDVGDRCLVTGPLYHAAPLTFGLIFSLQWGGPVVVMRNWDPAEALRLIDEHRVTHVHFVPTMFHRLLALPEEVRASADVSSLKAVHHGAAPCPVQVKHAMIDWFGPVIIEYYASTEGGGSRVDSATWLTRPGTVGQPPPGSVSVGTEDGEPLPDGEIGLIYIQAPAGAFAYHGDADKTASTFRKAGYFTLGDLGYLDDDGFLFLTDRSSNLIISGGVNIYPAEIDAVLLTHPAVGDGSAVGVPDDEWGESVLAVVELRDGLTPSERLADEIRAHCHERLAGFKVPRRVEFVDAIPRTDAGKISRHLLRKQFRDLD